VLVGDGPLRRELQKRIPEAVFAGLRKGADLGRHFASGDLFFFPSLTETYGNVTLEAMASGLAVAAFDYAAAGELIADGVNGILASRTDDEGFVARAAALAVDPARVRELGERARATCAAQSWDRVVEQLEQVLIATANTPVTDARRDRRAVPALLPQSARR
jgi:glycosyltransferase involved in cell wall biosynthesis